MMFGLLRVVLLALLAWALAMILPSLYQVFRPLASFGLSADNNGVAIDVVSPFESAARSPAAAAGLAIGDHIDLRRMNCLVPDSRACEGLVNVLGGSAGLQYTWPGDEIDLVVIHGQEGASRLVHLRAASAALGLPNRLVLLANTLAGAVFVLAAFWLAWIRPGKMTWGFFLYAIWFNPGQSYAYYALLQPWPAALLLQQCAEGLAVGAAYAGLLLFALRFPHDAPDARWRRWEQAAPWIGVALAVLPVLGGANLLGLPTEPIVVAGYVSGYAVIIVVLGVLLVRRRDLHPRDEQRMRWVIAGCAIGLPSFIFASVCQATGLLQHVWGGAPSQAVVGLLFLVHGVLGYFVWVAVRRQRVLPVSIPLRHGSITTALTLALAVPIVFLHERLTAYQEDLHLPAWIWLLVIAPIVLIALERLREAAVELVDHACSRAYHQARHGLEQAGQAMLQAESFSAIDRLLTAEPLRHLRLCSAAVFREIDGALCRTGPAIGWGGAPLHRLQQGADAPATKCLSEEKPVRLPPDYWQREGLPPDEQAPCLAVPVCGGVLEGTAIVLLGPHQTGSDITPDECDMLQVLAACAARGYDRVEAEALRREVRALQARLAALANPATGR